METIILLVLTTFLMPMRSFSQNETNLQKEPLPLNESGKIEYSGVITIEGASQEELYLRAKSWFVNAFNDASEVIQMEDKEAGTLIGKGYSVFEYENFGINNKEKAYYTLSIYTKEERYKYVITDFYLQGYPDKYNPTPQKYTAEYLLIEYYYKPNGKPRSLMVDFKTAFMDYVPQLIGRIQAGMLTETPLQEDW